MARRSLLLSAGSYLPKEILTNAELAKRVDTTDEWISQRTGIKQRHIAAPGELTSDLAVHAAEQALHHAGLRGADIDMLLVATTTPDHTFPATATKVQQRIGMRGGFAMDIQAVCSGFVFALATADNFIKAGQAKTALVIGAETFSRILDWTDRTTCVLFADGAGAIVLQVAQAIERAYQAHFSGNEAAEEQANAIAELETSQAVPVVTNLILEASTLIFDTLGASAARKPVALDRHWRNARTLSSHNPRIYKDRIVGDFAVNGTPPPYQWRIGQAPG